MSAIQDEALRTLGHWSNPLAVPPPVCPSPESPAPEPVPLPEQAEELKAALARDFPDWSIWYTCAQWYAAGPCPCAPGCSGRRTLHAETADLLRSELEQTAARLAKGRAGKSSP